MESPSASEAAADIGSKVDLSGAAYAQQAGRSVVRTARTLVGPFDRFLIYRNAKRRPYRDIADPRSRLHPSEGAGKCLCG
jgi:hypothetical protein